MTISGAKKQLNEDFFDIDANENKTINALNLKFKLNKINKLIKDLKSITEFNSHHNVNQSQAPHQFPLINEGLFVSLKKSSQVGNKAENDYK